MATGQFKPLYALVHEMLLGEILRGRYPIGHIFDESTLSARFKTSVGTLRRVMKELEKLGFVERKTGVGTRLIYSSPDEMMRRFLPLVRKDGVRINPKSKVLESERISTDVAANFCLFNKSALLRLHRVRSIDGIPVMLDMVTIPELLFPGIHEFEGDDLYVEYMRRYNVHIRDVEETITVENRRDISCKFHDFLPNDVECFLKVERVANAWLHNCVEHRISYIVSKDYVYSAHRS